MMAGSEKTTNEFAPLTLGTAGRERRFTSGVMVESSHPAGQALPKHAHEHPDITIVCEGGIETGVGRETLGCAPFDVLYLPGECQHTNVFSPHGTRTLIVELSAECHELIDVRRNLPDAASVASPVSSFRLARRIQSEFHNVDRTSELALQELVLQLVDAVGWQDAYKRHDSSPKWLANVVEFLNYGFAERLNMESLAVMAGVHSMHLARVFRRHFSCSIGNYVRTRRLEAAARQIEHGESSIAKIAADNGFYDQSHFTRFFKRQMGVAPTRYAELKGNRGRASSVQDDSRGDA